MIATHSLIGPAQSVLETARQLLAGDRVAILCDGNPGVGKSHLLDTLALELTGSPYSIETLNGQSLGVDVVREWRQRAPYGNLFSSWTVKRIDELDLAGPSATSELLTYLDYLAPRHAVLATTNDYPRLRANSKGRLETRFVRFHVDAPTVEQATNFLCQFRQLPGNVAREIAKGSIPDGCLASEGVNMRACMRDSDGYLAAINARNGKAVAA